MTRGTFKTQAIGGFVGVLAGGLALIVGISVTQIFLAPDLNTVTIHKQQDRVSLPCPDQGEGS